MFASIETAQFFFFRNAEAHSLLDDEEDEECA
jgi:hypothetical protein